MTSSKSFDGYSRLCINRRIRLIMTVNAFCDCFGFITLLLKSFLYYNSPQFKDTLYSIFSLLMMFKITLYISGKIYKEKLHKIQNSPSFPNKFKSITTIMENLFSIPTLKQSWNIFMILLQPCIIYPSWINQHLVILTQLRVYELVGFYFDIKLRTNPDRERVCEIENIDVNELCWKISFNHRYFKYGILGIMIIVIFGFGNIVKDYEPSGLMDIYEVIYFMMVSMSTVGFGELESTQTLPRIITVICIILGIFLSSLIASKVLAESKLNLKQEREYYLVRKLELDEKVQQLLKILLIQQLDNSKREQMDQQNPGGSKDYEQIYNLSEQVEAIVREAKSISEINPTAISFITNTARRQVDKLTSLNLINSYFINTCKNFRNKVKRREGHRYCQQFLSPY